MAAEEEKASELVEALKDADPETVSEIRQAEAAGPARQRVLSAADKRLAELEGVEDVDDLRRDPAGRVLHPWEKTRTTESETVRG